MMTTRIPAIEGNFGNRLKTYSAQLSVSDVLNFLGHDPRSLKWKHLRGEVQEIYNFMQRKTAKGRRDSVNQYIQDRLCNEPMAIGAFPALCIAMQNPVDFQTEGDSSMGEILLDSSPNNVRLLADGLGRLTGALALIDEGVDPDEINFLFPVVVYAPVPGTILSWAEMGQIFHDFNFRVQPVTKSHAIALDMSDIYIVLANKVGEAAFVSENGGVASRAASLGKKSSNLVVQTVLVRAVRGACEGRQFQESDMATVDSPNLTKQSLIACRDSITSFFGTLADLMGAQFADRDSLHLTSPGWQALGVLHHDLVFRLKLDAADVRRCLLKVSQIDWSRYNPTWQAIGIGQAEVDKVSGTTVKNAAGQTRVALSAAGRTTVQRILTHLRETCGISDALNNLQEAA